VEFQKTVCFNLDAIMAGNTDVQRAHEKCLLAMESKLDDLLQQSDASKRVNNDLLEAYHVSCEENTHLKTAIKELTRKIMEQTSPPTPPSPDIPNNPSAGEEMSLYSAISRMCWKRFATPQARGNAPPTTTTMMRNQCPHPPADLHHNDSEMHHWFTA
jgi:hypothetical protein